MSRFPCAVIAVLAFCGTVQAVAGAQSTMAGSMQMTPQTGRGENDFGKTNDFQDGLLAEDRYTQGYYCDTSVPAGSTTGCEAGTKFRKPPAPNFDPLYITVPLGFTVPPMFMQCPTGLVCVDHPPTIDLSAIGGPANAPTPGHDHFTTTNNNGNPEWWDVQVVGVKSAATWNQIKFHASYAYIQMLIKAGNPNVTKPIPTNLFLYFAVRN